jgi:hypothetical protein
MIATHVPSRVMDGGSANWLTAFNNLEEQAASVCNPRGAGRDILLQIVKD